MGKSTVDSIVKDQNDSTGAAIETVYAKVVPYYAVYRTAERVIVHYADDDQLGSEQRRALIESNPLKGEINGLIDGWRKSKSASEQTRARLFDRRVADALVVALQGDRAHAVEVLSQTKRDIVAVRTSIARTSYLFTSCAATAIFASVFGALYLSHAEPGAADGFFASMCLAGAVGALGAFFSIALAIRGRQIGTDLQWRDNHTDAALRVTIGSISGVVLYWLLQAKIVTFGLGAEPIAGSLDGGSVDVRRSLALVIAFAAGFTERLVGDLLGRAVLGVAGAASNPLAGTAATPATASAGDKTAASETNPLGKSPTAVVTVAAGADEFIDGCFDHAALGPDELTRDIELPEASGGVAGRA